MENQLRCPAKLNGSREAREGQTMILCRFSGNWCDKYEINSAGELVCKCVYLSVNGREKKKKR